MNRAWLCAALLTLLPAAAKAENISGVTALSNGIYALQIDGRNYMALPSDKYQQNLKLLGAAASCAADLEATAAKLKEYQTLTSQYEELKGKYAALARDYQRLSEDSLRLNGDYASAADNLLTLNQGYSRLAHDYDALAEKYRTIALRTHPRKPLDIGIGAIASDNKTNGVLMVGAGTSLLNVELRGWLLGGPDHYGLIVGSSF